MPDLPDGYTLGVCKPNRWTAFRERPGGKTLRAEGKTRAELEARCREVDAEACQTTGKAVLPR